MLAAGGLIALLLVGFIAEGVILSENKEDEEEKDPNLEEDGVEDAPKVTSGTGIADFLFGSDHADHIEARAGDDTVHGGGGDDYLHGDDGDDTLDGQAGNDTLVGGKGDDALRLGANDVGFGGPGADLFRVTNTAANEEGDTIACVSDFELGSDQLVLDFPGGAADTPEITFDCDSNPGSTLVLADGVPVTLLDGTPQISMTDLQIRMAEDGIVGMGSGNDASGAYAGADLMDGGTTDDLLRGRAGMHHQFDNGQDAITGGHDADLLQGGRGDDALFGNEGDDVIAGKTGADELYGDAGHDSLSGGEGTDFLSGGEGDDSLSGGTGSDLLFGGDGDDTLEGDAGGDFLQGGLGADSLSGGDGNDRLDGTFTLGDALFGPFDEDAADTLDGGSGDDTLLIGAGDVATGGDGADTFITGSYVEAADLAGTVTDFDPSVDVIEVMYDPGLTPNPVLSVADHSDAGGADILLNGKVILSVTGAQGLTVDQIDMRAVTFDPVPEPA